MVWFLSDLHGKMTDGLRKYLENREKDDLLILLGDTELYFDGSESNRSFSDQLLSLDCDIALIDGNHDNYDFLNSCPVEIWHGGSVHRIGKRMVHLMRGQIFSIEENSFLAMGGCSSTEKWAKTSLWWSCEQASREELSLAYENLRKRGNQVDYILTHKYTNPSHTFRNDSAEEFAEYIRQNVTYRHWYSGHWHQFERLDAFHTVVFDELVPLSGQNQKQEQNT